MAPADEEQVRFAIGRRTLAAALLLIAALDASIAHGDVATMVSGSKLIVTGDATPDAVAIEPAPDGGVLVLGLEGTLVDGSSVGVAVSGVTRLKVKLKQGADRLTLTQVTFSDGIALRLGDGNDWVVLDQVYAGATRIRTGNGSDFVDVYGPGRCRHLTLLTDRGFDSIVVDGLWIPRDLYVDTGSDDDDVTIVSTEIGDDARVYLGSDEDVLVLADVAVYDDTDLDGDDGDDWLYFYGYVWFDDDLSIDGFNDDWWW
jgi:hypothetical protein